MNFDDLQIEILPDGTIKTTTPKISAANHQNSAEFLKFLATLTGGATDIKKRGKHEHAHNHEHTHGSN